MVAKYHRFTDNFTVNIVWGDFLLRYYLFLFCMYSIVLKDLYGIVCSWHIKELQSAYSGTSATGTVNTVTLTQSCSTQRQRFQVAMSRLHQVASTLALLPPARFQWALQWLEQIKADCRTGAWETQAVCHAEAWEILPDVVDQDLLN